MMFIAHTMAWLRDNWDAIMMLFSVGIVLMFLEWRLGVMFNRHEEVERRQYAELSMVADAAAANARELGRQLGGLREEAERSKIVVEGLVDEVRMHDRRLGAVEERLMRAALSVPRRRDEDAS